MQKIAADEVKTGMRISHREQYSRYTDEGIVIDVDRYFADPIDRITFTVWSMEHGYDEFTVWECDEVALLWAGTNA